MFALMAGRLEEVIYVLASGLSAFDTQSVALQAGRVMLTRLHQLAARHRHFAFETTLATRSYLPWLRTLQAEGFAIDLAFLWLPSPEIAIARVTERVRLGGHDVPETVIRRRYRRGLGNFFRLYREHADRWWLYDNAATDPQRFIAAGGKQGTTHLSRPDVWQNLLETHQ